MAISRRRASATSSPSTTTRFRRPEAPDDSETAERGTPSRSAMNRMRRLFAAPSTGGAAKRILIASPNVPTTSVRAARGCA